MGIGHIWGSSPLILYPPLLQQILVGVRSNICVVKLGGLLRKVQLRLATLSIHRSRFFTL